MPIKTSPSAEISFLTNYTPYSPPTGTVVVENIKDMITFDLQPKTTPTILNYSIGTDKSYVNTITIKNITTNAKINIQLSFNNNIFIVDRTNVTVNNQNTILVELRPNQTEQFEIKVKNSMLDQKMTYQLQQTQIKMNIQSIEINDVVLKNLSTSVFTTQVFPETITLD